MSERTYRIIYKGDIIDKLPQDDSAKLNSDGNTIHEVSFTLEDMPPSQRIFAVSKLTQTVTEEADQRGQVLSIQMMLNQ